MSPFFRRRPQPEVESSCRWTADERGFWFEVIDDGGRPVTFPLSLAPDGRSLRLAPAIERQALAIDELILDGTMQLDNDRPVLAHRSYYDLDTSTRQLIGLPPEEDCACAISCRGVASSEKFSVSAEVSHREVGRLEGYFPRVGGTYLLSSTRVVILRRSLFDLLDTIDAGLPEGIPDLVRSRLIYVERVRRKARRAAVSIEQFLANESYILPEDGRIGVNVAKVDDQSLIISPVLHSHSEEEVDPGALEEINRSLGSKDAARGLLTAPAAAGGRVRAILDQRAVKSIVELGQRREIKGADVPRFLENPEAFLPDDIDLSDFSDRVIGIGIQRVSVRPSLSLQRSQDGLIDFRANVESRPLGLESSPGFESGETITGADLPALVAAAKEQSEDYVFFKGKWVHVDVAALDEFQAAVQRAESKFERRKVREKEFRGFLEIFTNLEALEYDRATRDLVAELREAEPEDGPKYPLPVCLRANLLEHQKRGYLWLRVLADQRWGGLLADDMGLGKTVQAISLLAALKDQSESSPSLVVVPKSVLPNWGRELREFCPSLVVHEHHGAERIRDAAGIKSLAGRVDVILTTYDLLRRDQIALCQVDWKAVVLDEAQNIKNPRTGVSTAGRALKTVHTRLALTGTPVENGLGDLWSIFDFVLPGRLGSYLEFRQNYERPIQERNSVEAAEELKSRIGDVYLRRLKEDELDGLPKKAEVREMLPLGERQRDLYVSLVSRAARAAGPVIGVLQHLVQLCSHPDLIVEEPSLPPARELIGRCPKLEWTIKVLDEIRQLGEGVMIFTEYRRMQELLVHVIQEKFGVWAGRINGDVSGGERQRLVDAMNDGGGFRVLVASPTAGGVGLNVTGANHVIHYTRLWNPAKEAQATARAHRIGQTKTVNVYYPIAIDSEFETIETRIDRLLGDKAELARDIITPSAGLQISALELLDLLGEESGQASRDEISESNGRLEIRVGDAPKRPSDDVVEEWLKVFDDRGVRDVFAHIQRHNAINEKDATQMLGGPRQFRRFSQNLEIYVEQVPFGIRIDVANGVKRYVKETG